MKNLKRAAILLLALVMALSCAACGSSTTTAATATDTTSLAFDNSKWNYDADNDVYWQIGVSYCAAPQAADYETMGIYVPGTYLTGTKNSDGTYTCKVNASGKAAGYTASTAPVVIPVNTPGYSASAAPTEYSYDSVSSYIEAGFVYVQPGIRGRASMSGAASSDESYSGGAPWGVTDLKAAIRYCRYNKDALPGSMDSIFTFGMSGGGAQSALVGATGDSELYTPYLQAIGAAMKDASGAAISDAVAGSMCWCPITSLDYADEAYEWNMGQFASADSRADGTFTAALSKDLAKAYADYINELKLKNGDTVLTLSESQDGIYQSGTYYDYLLSVVNQSLNNFLADTTFPYTYTETAQFPGGSAGTMGGGTGGVRPSGALPSGQIPSGTGTMPTGTADTSSASSGTTYETAQDYIDSLNADTQWVTYDAATNTAKASSLAAFAETCKTPTKAIGAFDEIDRGQGENNLFGNGQSQSLHFDEELAELLEDNKAAYSAYSDWKDSYVTDYESDLETKDSLGTDVEDRVDMYNPMYFLNSYYDGCGSSTVAKYWRIRTGAFQSDTALTVETNLALALENTEGVDSVDFATVWNMKHVEAERTGDSTTNFIAWVNTCLGA